MPSEESFVRLPAIGGSKHKQHVSARRIGETDDEGFLVIGSRRFVPVQIPVFPSRKLAMVSDAIDFSGGGKVETYTPRKYYENDQECTYYALASISDIDAWEQFKRWLLPDRA